MYQNFAFIGANEDDDSQTNTGLTFFIFFDIIGSVYFYQQTLGYWTYIMKLMCPDAVTDTNFGISTAIFETKAFIGAEYYNIPGGYSDVGRIYTI